MVKWLAVWGCEKKEIAAEANDAGKEVSMPVTLQWLGHASFKISYNDVTIYIDPWKVDQSAKDGSLVLVSHNHYDHYSAADVRKVWGPGTRLIAPADVVGQEGRGEVIEPGQTIEADNVSITGVASYNPDKQFHPKTQNWLGFIIEMDSTRIYYAGDTDLTSEMKALENIDVALLPVGGTYTMDADEAARAVEYIKPKRAIPYHWGDIVGRGSDAKRFAEKAKCEVTVLKPGESVFIYD